MNATTPTTSTGWSVLTSSNGQQPATGWAFSSFQELDFDGADAVKVSSVTASRPSLCTSPLRGCQVGIGQKTLDQPCLVAVDYNLIDHD